MTRNNSACIRLPALIICLWGMATAATGAGPDLILGSLDEFEQFGREGSVGSGTVGLAIGNDTCNKGDETVHWFKLPNTDHPVFPQNMYRLMTVDGSERIEQIGLSWMKHGYGAGQWDACNFGCDPFPNESQIGVGCSDFYTVAQNGDHCALGPRSAIHPYTGEILGGDDLGPGGSCIDFFPNVPSKNHIGHAHNGISHRLQVQDVDLIKSLNPGARYFAEMQIITRHEYTAGNDNQNNNVSHREYFVYGPDVDGGYAFAPPTVTLAELPAFNALPGASQTMIEPAPLVDGRAFLVYKASNLGDGLWHYEYALYNMHLDESLGSISIPIPDDVTIGSIGFHAPRNHAPEPWADNYGNDPWEVETAGGAITWSTDPFAVDPLANAVRWGTLYNFRFDANAPPQAVDATVGLFKTGDVTPAATVGPSAAGPRDCNANSIDDRCDLDCDAPGCAVVGCGESEDCTGNGIPDECEADCNNNNTADRCELLNGTAGDCNENGIPDQCDPGGGSDCNSNQTPDSCDIFLGTSGDYNQNGIPDECDPHLGTIHVDDDAPADPGPGDPTISDPAEDGTMGHPFDAIQEAIDVSLSSDVIVMADGTYTGQGNRNLSYGGRAITVRSENGPESCVIDLEDAAGGFYFEGGESADARLEGLTIINAIGSSTYPVVEGDPAISIGNGSPTIFNCVISGNGDPAIVVWGISSPAFVGCRITDNYRIGFQCFGGRPTLDNSLVANNGTTGVRVVYGHAAVFMSNCTVTGNSTGVGGSALTVRNSVIWGNGTAASASPDISYSNVQGGSAGIGNIDADPLFVDPEGDNYRLGASSPSIDAGGNMSTCTTIDLDGNPRFLDDPDTADTGSGVPPIVDMGAYEFVPDDCNDNGTPDAEEILLDPNLDSNGNGVLDECEPSFADCNANGLPDFCEPDCNANGVPDDCDIADITSDDCNGNGSPDQCDIADGTSPDCNVNEIPDDCEPDADADGVLDVCDVCAGFNDQADCDADSTPNGCEISVADGGLCTGEDCSADCNANGIPDECELANGISRDCNVNEIPDDCETDADADGVPDSCDVCPGFDDQADCDDDSTANGCQISVGDGGLCTGEECSPDCDGNGIPDGCDLASCNVRPDCSDCQPNGIPDGCDIDTGASDDDNGNRVPDECDTPEPLGLPPNVAHHVTKHRYLSVDTSANPGREVALKVELASMKRCTGDLSRACIVDTDCRGFCENDGDTACVTSAQCGGDACIPTAPCTEHPDVGLSWWVQEPYQVSDGCLPDNVCGDEDWVARLGASVYTRAWTLQTLHIGDCEVIPVASYLVYACNVELNEICSAPLTIPTQPLPLNAPGARGSYGDVAGPVARRTLEFAPPDGYVNTIDTLGYMLTKQNYGTLNEPQAHPTWVDLHGPVGSGNPPQYILNVTDLSQIKFGFLGNPWTNDPGNLQPGGCP